MNNYKGALNVFFDNIDNDLRKFYDEYDYENHCSHYPYSENEYYQNGFIAFKNELKKKYENNDFIIIGNYAKSNMHALDPNITLKKYVEKNEKGIKKDGLYIYFHFPTSSVERKLDVSLELGGINDSDHSRKVKVLYGIIENNLLNAKNILSEFGKVDINTNNEELLKITIYNFDSVEIVIEKLVALYSEILKKLTINDWKESWNNVKKELFGEEETKTNNQGSEGEFKPGSVDNKKARNIIFYGGPGCGKSKHVEITYCKHNNCIDKNGKPCDNYIRTTFYPDYTNSDFVGQLIPKRNESGMEYVVSPGPFTRALERAELNKDKHIYLIIEEINRGNAAAIFGDLFQLLDRVKTSDEGKEIGESEYEICNSVIDDYFIQENLKELNGNIKIPKNLSIIATMNTSDQNVFTLDSAFKRRWEMHYITNKFSTNGYDHILGSKAIPIKLEEDVTEPITWEKFVKNINIAIIKQNTFGINSEDKQIGKFFVGESDLLDKDNLKNKEIYKTNEFKDAARVFAEKVLMYLWEDVAKIKPSDWFNENIKSFESLLDEYEKNGIKVFNENIKKIINSDDNDR